MSDQTFIMLIVSEMAKYCNIFLTHRYSTAKQLDK